MSENSVGVGPVEEVARVAEALSAGDDQLIEMLVDRARSEGLQLAGAGGLLQQLTKRVLESALDGEITDHLGYDKHDPVGKNSGNSRNGSRDKTVLTEVGPVPPVSTSGCTAAKRRARSKNPAFARVAHDLRRPFARSGEIEWSASVMPRKIGACPDDMPGSASGLPASLAEYGWVAAGLSAVCPERAQRLHELGRRGRRYRHARLSTGSPAMTC